MSASFDAEQLSVEHEPIAAKLAGFVTDLRFDNLPDHVVLAAKALVCDQLACQLIGSTMSWVAPALELVKLTEGATPESTIVNQPGRYLAAEAAFVNATYGQACELDDSTYGSAGHIGTATIPVAFAVGEREGISGRQFLAAVVAGYEVMFRLMASIRPHHNTRGFHSQSIAGPFAGAAAAGKILGLSTAEMTHALAIAGSHSCGPLEYDQSGGEVKRIHAGIAARAGVHSALLAKSGLTGPATIIEGKRGFCRVFSTQHDLAPLTAELGNTFNITNVWFKIYPATGPVHTAIQATAKLVAQHDIRPDEVARIKIGVAETSLMHGGGIVQPQDVIGAQFSLAYSIALAIVRRNNTLGDYMNPSLWRDPRINTVMLMAKAHADTEARGLRQHRATVTIELKDGRALTAVEEHPVGTPPNPASREQLRAKVHDLAGAVLPKDRIESMIAAIGSLEQLPDLSVLSDILAKSRPA